MCVCAPGRPGESVREEARAMANVVARTRCRHRQVSSQSRHRERLRVIGKEVVARLVCERYRDVGSSVHRGRVAEARAKR